MALNRKYAALPDLDSAPDIYETPSLTDDNSTAPPHTARSQSAASDYQDFDDESSAVISRSHLQTAAARTLFEPARIDARDVDFSDRVAGKRKSYKVSSRRYRRREDGEEELGDLSDEEENGEGVQRKLARLRRELEEVKEEVGRRKAEGEGKDMEESQDVTALSRMLDEISINNAQASGIAASTRLSQALSTPLKPLSPTPQPKPAASNAHPNSTGPPTYTITYAPSHPDSHALAKAAAFDSRLTFLETALGIPPLTSTSTPLTILPTLSTLERQLSVLSTSTPSSLDAISRRVRTLTQEAERLAEARKASEEDEAKDSEDGADRVGSGNVAKINALYGTLATIEQLEPLLPNLLERLRSLRAIHAEAATAGERMERAMRAQEEMGKEIVRWREGLERVEEAVAKGEKVAGGNLKVVEGWVKELEGRVAGLGV